MLSYRVRDIPVGLRSIPYKPLKIFKSPSALWTANKKPIYLDPSLNFTQLNVGTHFFLLQAHKAESHTGHSVRIFRIWVSVHLCFELKLSAKPSWEVHINKTIKKCTRKKIAGDGSPPELGQMLWLLQQHHLMEVLPSSGGQVPRCPGVTA